jgi:hypothetical protein
MMMDDLRPVASPRVARIQGVIHLYLRSLAVVLLLLGLMHWTIVLGVFVNPAWRFETMPTAWQAATIVLAVANPVAGVGLWMRVAWGVVIWIAAALFEIVIHVGLTRLFGFNPLIVGFHFVTLGIYAGLQVALRRAASRR